MSAYSFGDSGIARERLGLVAAAFEAPTRSILNEIPPGDRRYVLDLGCGPGYTTALLAQRFVGAFLTGLDASGAMIEDARRRVPEAHFAVADITAPLLLPAQVVYSRLLLGHLPDPHGALANWAAALRPGGVIVCEEPVRYRGGDEWFERYEAAVTGVVARRGAQLWAGDTLAVASPPNCERVVDRVVEHPVSIAHAAGMFWRNATTWQAEVDDGAALVEHFRAREQATGAGPDHEGDVTWEIRQTMWVTR